MAPPAPAKKGGCLKWGLITVAVLILLGVIAAIAGGGTKSNSGSSASSSSSASSVSPTDTARSSAVPTTSAAATGPAAPDASPYVKGFGDLSVVSLPAGKPGAVSIIASSTTLDSSGSVTIVVRNNTRKAVGKIDITGTARDDAGKLVGSGDSQVSLQPKVVAPGEIAYGYVYFKTDSPAGSALKFDFSVDARPPDTYFLPLTISEINNTGDTIIGTVTNDTGGKMTGPIGADVICFGSDGSIIRTKQAFVEQSDLPAAAIGSFSIDLYGNACPVGLVAASGFGHL